MHTRDHQIKPEYRQGVLKVLHYISQNLSGDVSLETLAGIASYSLFHFQKIFSEAISESPKQYVMRLRLERAAHHLKVFPNLPVTEIAMGCGFSSPSIFSRAFRNYYRVSAEEFREMSMADISVITKQTKKKNEPIAPNDSGLWISKISNPMEVVNTIQISPPPLVKTFKSLKIACIQTTLSYPESISFAFKSLMQWAIPNDIVTPDIKYVGIWLDVPFYTSPDKCRYIAGIELKNEIKTNKGIDVLIIDEGKYVGFSMKGNPEATLNKLIALNHKYLEDMGYEFADIICYEIFDECPANKPYEELQRNILVPVKPR
jgi:Transcriptional regulator containing an amidase domain and an AraC-type DNA-binding HTH domain